MSSITTAHEAAGSITVDGEETARHARRRASGRAAAALATWYAVFLIALAIRPSWLGHELVAGVVLWHVLGLSGLVAAWTIAASYLRRSEQIATGQVLRSRS